MKISRNFTDVCENVKIRLELQKKCKRLWTFREISESGDNISFRMSNSIQSLGARRRRPREAPGARVHLEPRHPGGRARAPHREGGWTPQLPDRTPNPNFQLLLIIENSGTLLPQLFAAFLKSPEISAVSEENLWNSENILSKLIEKTTQLLQNPKIAKFWWKLAKIRQRIAQNLERFWV